jgi:hypothetical protein
MKLDPIDVLVGELEAAAEKATPGPWYLQINNCTASILVNRTPGSYGQAVALLQQVSKPVTVANATFIALANPTAILEILAAYKSLRLRVLGDTDKTSASGE